MLTSNKEVIEEYRRKQLDQICNEKEEHGSYEEQYERLQAYRKAFKKRHTDMRSPWNTYRIVRERNSEGDKLDHHLLAYLAPLDFRRVGMGG